MPYEIDPDEMEAAINLAMLSPIPVVPKRSATDFLSASSSAFAAASPHAASSPRWITPADQERQLLSNIGSDKVLITDVQRTEMSRQIYMIIRSTNLPQSFQNTTTSPQLILISRAIENKLFERAESYQSYLDLSTLAFRLSALACAVLIYTEEYKDGQNNKPETRSETCSRLLAAARNSLSHSVMVLIMFESQQLGFIQGN